MVSAVLLLLLLCRERERSARMKRHWQGFL